MRYGYDDRLTQEEQANIHGNDIFDVHEIFDNEQTAIDFVSSKYNIDKNAILEKLHEEDFLIEEVGKIKCLGTFSWEAEHHFSLCELITGRYVIVSLY